MNLYRDSKNCCYTLSYAVDIATLISGEFPNSVSELLQEAFEYGTAVVWHNSDICQLQKMVTVRFTRKRHLRGLKETTISAHKPFSDTRWKRMLKSYLATVNMYDSINYVWIKIQDDNGYTKTGSCITHNKTEEFESMFIHLAFTGLCIVI